MAIVWVLLPIPAETLTIRNIDLLGFAPLAVATLLSFAASLKWRPSNLKYPDVILITLIGAMILFVSSEIFRLPLIISSSGVNLVLVFLPSSLFVFVRLGKERLARTLVGVFCMIGFPILVLDIFFWLSLPYMSDLPVSFFVIGGLGLQDGLNLVVVSLLIGCATMAGFQKVFRPSGAK